MFYTEVLILLCDSKRKPFSVFLGTSVWNYAGKPDASASIFGFACSSSVFWCVVLLFLALV